MQQLEEGHLEDKQTGCLAHSFFSAFMLQAYISNDGGLYKLKTVAQHIRLCRWCSQTCCSRRHVLDDWQDPREGSHVVGHIDGVQLVGQEAVTQVHALLLTT